MDTYDTLSEAITEAHKDACGCRGGQDTQYYKDEAGMFGFINHERGTTIELADGLLEISDDYNDRSYHESKFAKAEWDAMEAYREWYDSIFMKEFEEIITFYSPLVASVLNAYDSSDGHGGDLHPIITAEQCVDRYIRLLAEAICDEHGIDLGAVEKEIRERITDKGQTEEEIRLALSPSVKRALESLDKPVTDTPEMDLF
ncbi:MAG: hypothetical protein IAE94_09660 [Chthoniobacterales bacterium]|nr:hypothetical protein [Chthoniobacterales bacterium]